MIDIYTHTHSHFSHLHNAQDSSYAIYDYYVRS
jgi:hypothetical protein